MLVVQLFYQDEGFLRITPSTRAQSLAPAFAYPLWDPTIFRLIAAYAMDWRVAHVRLIFVVVMRIAFIGTLALLVALACVLITGYNNKPANITP
jgi:hypothetical protein